MATPTHEQVTALDDAVIALLAAGMSEEEITDRVQTTVSDYEPEGADEHTE